MPRLDPETRDGKVYNFGNTQPLPLGYSVVWHKCHHAYQGHGPNDWATVPTDDPFEARYLCIEHATPGRVDIWDRWYSRMIRQNSDFVRSGTLLARLWDSPAYQRAKATALPQE